jgi:polyphosphate kinase
MDCLENRELSWLKFNKRVLEEAVDKNVPLLERLTFCSIYQSNLDEFFRVRVGSITDDEKNHKNSIENKTKMKPAQQLDAIFTAVRRMQPLVEDAYRKTFSELSEYGFEHITFDTADKDELLFLELYFRRELKPFLSGIIVNDSMPFPFLRNGDIYAAVQIQTKKNVTIGIVPVKHEHSERIIPLGNGGKRFILEEEVVLHFAHLLFKGYKLTDRTLIRITRSADIMISGKGSDFRERMEELVAKRKKLAPVRLEVSNDFSRAALDYICGKLKLKNERVFVSRIPLDLSFLFSMGDLCDIPELHYTPRSPRKSASISDSRSIFSQIKSKDILLSYPYESINSSFIRLLLEAADDPKVTSIKITLYRLASSSKVIEALCAAAENGKDVLVMIELRARFDEENNIGWSKVLQKAGCHVIYGPNNYKAHSKLLLITRKGTNGSYEYVTQIGTGNYNEKTARLYTDLTLMTADRDISEDAGKVFDCLCNGTFVEETKKLLVAPLCLRNPLMKMMDEQIEIARNGGNGYIAAKINSLTDKKIIMKLIEASQSGVKIDLVIRGICCLTAGVEGYTENITVRSIVGRFLEHSRIYIFGENNPDRKIYISSADYMTRNTINRVEVAAPILDERLKKRVSDMFNILMSDNVKARVMMNDGTYVHVQPQENETPLNAQEYFYDEAYRLAEEKKRLREKREEQKKSRKSGKRS